MKQLYLKQKMFSVKDRYKVYDDKQDLLYHCEARLMTLVPKIDIILTAEKKLLYTLKRKRLSFMPTYFLVDGEGRQVALIKQKFSMRKQKFFIESTYGHFAIEGNYWAHNFGILKDQTEVVHVQKKLLSWGDTYEINIQDETLEPFYIALVIMIDSTLHNRRKRR